MYAKHGIYRSVTCNLFGHVVEILSLCLLTMVAVR